MLSEKTKTVARWILAVLILAFLVLGLVSNWSHLKEHDVSIHYFQLGLATLFNMVFLFSQAFAWRYFVVFLGHDLKTATGTSIWINSQLSKYVPGKVMLLLVRVIYCERVGVPKTSTLLSIYLELVLMIVTGTGLFLLCCREWLTQLGSLHLHPIIPALLIVAGVIGLHPRILNPMVNLGLRILKAPAIRIDISYAKIIALGMVVVVGWVFHGLAGIASVKSVGITPAAGLFLHTGFFAIAWVLGFLSFLTPGGIGVREGVLALALGTIYPMEIAIAVSLISRVAWVAAEIVLAGLFLNYRPRAPKIPEDGTA